jgi:serine/threonine-protein kinase
MLGQGAMGSAYLASHPVLRVPLVIKTFNTSKDINIFEEAHLAARITSPNVVAVLDAGTERGIPFVIHRYVDGIDLEELIGRLQKTGARLPLSIVCRIIIDVARGLHAIHQAGVVHRDVKPANLFLCGNGSTMVGDFGIALDSLKEQEGQLIAGTPVFMAPEQWDGQKADRRTDIYALGATAHLLATGQPPFKAESLAEFMEAHVSKPYVPLAPISPGEAYLFSVIERLLRKRPEERFQLAQAVARTLDVIAEPVPQVICTGQDEARIGPLHITLSLGDITASAADVIVNAANAWLVMDVGVAGALKEAGGISIQEEAITEGPVAMGDVVWTGAGTLRAKWVAHAVAALEGAICLQRSTLRVLLGAESRQAGSVVFPALGTGVGEVPMDLAAKLILETMQTFASLQPRHARNITVVLHNSSALYRWRTILQSMSPVEERASSFTQDESIPVTRDASRTVSSEIKVTSFEAETILSSDLPVPQPEIIRRCPVCENQYSDEKRFCVYDGTPLEDASRAEYEWPTEDLATELESSPAQTITADLSDSFPARLEVREGMILDNRYRVLKELGSGGMGQVYLAEQIGIRRNVAVKVMHGLSGEQEDRLLSYFRQEALALARLNHPNIAQIYDADTSGDALYIAMEFLEGTLLRDRIRQNRTIPAKETARVLREACAGLEAAHHASIIHRDIKPENIMLIRDEAAIERVKILDFGLAILEGRDAEMRVTAAGAFAGTMLYMSPEQMQGLELTPATDIYSLAVVGYEMLTGRMPLGDDTPLSVMRKKLHEAPAPLHDLAPETPSWLERALMRALEKDPERRFATAREFANALTSD